MSNTILTQDYIKNLFTYDGGNLRWKIRKAMRTKVGEIAGCVNNEGYRHIMIDGNKYLEHRLIWLWFKDEWPEEIDHINRNRCDNRIENLRKANRRINMQNAGLRNSNKTGITGVEFRDKHKYKKWVVNIGGGNSSKKIYLGSFSTLEEAISMRFTAEDSLYNL